MTAEDARGFYREATELLQPLAAKYGYSFRATGGQIDDVGLTMRFRIDAPAAKAAADEENFKIDAPLVGLEPDDLGKTFRVGRATYTITGIRIGAPRFPVLGRRADGKTFKFGVDTVRLALGRQPKPRLFGSSAVPPPPPIPGWGKTFGSERGDD